MSKDKFVLVLRHCCLTRNMLKTSLSRSETKRQIKGLARVFRDRQRHTPKECLNVSNEADKEWVRTKGIIHRFLKSVIARSYK